MEKEELFQCLESCRMLPMPSKEISEILNILNNPLELDIDDLVEKVNKVDKLNDLMIQNLNTGYFRTNKEISTIKEAIIYLGMQTVQNLLIFFITIQLFSSVSEKEAVKRSFSMKHYFKHVLGTSLASSMLASELKIGDKYKLFSYGLIHDIGIAVLDTCVPEILDDVTLKLQTGVHQIIAERSFLGG
ncbi:HDOD domain-containing protein [Alkaliphilus metalliredigens]|uniref:HDOD domain-containing protein n=1 Tax=Alkaliphilus metalliredigens TaxID=208226 RepID=UPI0002DD380A|nr:HDOD domain-containing protein [Alkaliphilus metalliredigens]